MRRNSRRIRPAVVAVVAAVLLPLGAVAPAEARAPEPAPVRAEAPDLPSGPTDWSTAPEPLEPTDGEETVTAVVETEDGREVRTVEAEPDELAQVEAELERDPGVVEVVDVVVDAPARAAAVAPPNDTAIEEQWSYGELYRGAIPWDGESAGSSEIVAVLDSGVDGTHPDLAGRLLCADSADFTDIPADGPIDPHVGGGCIDPLGHGTHVAGIVGAEWNNGQGVAGVSQARILPVRVLDQDGVGSVVGITEGIRYAVDKGARVINMSIVGDGVEGASGYEDAVQYALDHDVVIVVSAGNNRQDGDLPQYPAALSDLYPNVFSVAATDGLHLSAPFSYQGPTNFIAAPGMDIFSTVPVAAGSYDNASGTSMAAPHVAGIIAWYRELHPTEDVAGIRAEVQRTAIDMETVGKDVSTGYGMIDMAELLTTTQAADESRYRSTVPAAPVITSVAQRVSGLKVAWRPSTWTGGNAIRAYAVDIWQQVEGSYAYLGYDEAPSTAKSLIIADLDAGQTYVFVVSANTVDFVDGQYSLDSGPIRFAPVPGAPVIRTPIAGDTAARARWSAPTRIGAAPIDHYVVKAYRGSTVVKRMEAPADAREIRFSGLTNGIAHTFVVWAVNAAGTSRPSARSATFTMSGVPGAPGIGRANAGDGAARARWSAPSSNGSPITGYVIKAYRGTAMVQRLEASASAREVRFSGLTNGKAYTFVVWAVNARGTGSPSKRSAAVIPEAR